eukprot:TRINITY_DN12893_c1_g1_i1.p1 TRINITY_DN12893_c1_g1~~TRINITY_DN12893_c1_g1_i1.p1  ORF type:complete len:273 (+),score=23.23 TRINITY_DN12893_c1_g1_i1:168-986(+)
MCIRDRVARITAAAVWCLAAHPTDALTDHPTAQLLLAGDAAGVVSVWNPDQSASSPEFTIVAHRGDGVSSVVTLEDGSLFTAGFDGALKEWCLPDRVCTSCVELRPPALQLCVSERYLAVLEGPASQPCVMVRSTMVVAWRCALPCRARGLALFGHRLVTSWTDQVLKVFNCEKGDLESETQGSYASLDVCCLTGQENVLGAEYYLLGASFGKPCFAHVWRVVQPQHGLPSPQHRQHRDTSVDLSSKSSTACLLYTSPSPRDRTRSRMPSSA